jgi:hypothetical protein
MEVGVFRRLTGKAQIGGPLNPASIAPIMRAGSSSLGLRWRDAGSRAPVFCSEGTSYPIIERLIVRVIVRAEECVVVRGWLWSPARS